MTSLGALTVRIGADMSGLMAAFREAETSTVKLGRRMQGVGQSLSMYVTAPLAAFAAVSVTAWNESAQALAGVESRVRSTGGAAGYTADQLAGMAEGLMGVTTFDDDDILSGVTQQLLTFGGIAGESFARAQVAALDLATVLGGDLQGKAIMLGKALSDPVRGMTALSRAGVTFTADQKAMVASLVASGDTLGAQAIILDEIENKYGGAAKAAAAAGTGPFQQFGNNVGELTEELGGFIARGLTPVVKGLNGLVSWMRELPGPVKLVAVGIAALAATIGPLIVGVGTVLIVLPKVKAALLALNQATIILTLKIVAAIAVIAVFAAAAYLIYKNWRGVKAFFVSLWKDVVAATTSAMGLVQARVEGAFLRLVRTMSGLGAKLLEPARRVAAGLGADGLAEQISGAQLGIENLVPESAVRTVEARAARLSASLGSAVGGLSATFRRAGAGAGQELAGLFAEVQASVTPATDLLGDMGDAAGDAAASVGAAGETMTRHLDTVVVSARRLFTALDRIDTSAMQLARLPELPSFTVADPRGRHAGRITPTFGGVDLSDVREQEMPANWLAIPPEHQLALDAARDTINGIAYAIGDAAAQLLQWRNPFESIKEAAKSLGASLGRVLQNVVADITAAIARMVILRTLMSFVPGGSFLGGILSTLAGGAKTGAAPIQIALQGGEMRMSHGMLLASVRAGLVEEQRTGRGPGTLF